MPWYSSWIPEIPYLNFSIPASIQGRFISFVLKKSLGHFLKPGQLDHRQIDSQIGSGYVQVSDLELNSEVINGYLHGVPLSLRDGTISSVKVRVPWPNPLASTLGFSLKSLHLNLIVAPVDSRPEAESDLADSVASVAESFVHEQLSSREGADLWQTFHHDLAAQAEFEDHPLPGGLESFASDSAGNLQFDVEPAGVSVFANLIEHLLSRFEFDAQDIKITLIHPENMGLTLHLQDIRYLTHIENDPTESSSASVRTLTVDGVSISSRKLASWMNPFSFSSNATFPTRSYSTETSKLPSRTSSNSSMDEQARFAMSQSMAVLPPRAASPVSSASSSMYESAISTTSSTIPNPQDIGELFRSPLHEQASTSVLEPPEDTIMTFGTQPIVLQIKTSASVSPVSEDDPFANSMDTSSSSEAELNINLSMGTIACAVKSWQTIGLVRLVRSMMPSENPTNVSPTKTPSSAKNIPPVKVNVALQTCVFILSAPPAGDNPAEKLAMAEFFIRPLIPLRLENGYTRIRLDSISTSLSRKRHLSGKATGTVSSQLPTELQFGIADISIFFFAKASHDKTSPLVAFPFIITDPGLPSQYAPFTHSQGCQVNSTLPTFDVIDWTQEGSRNFGTRLAPWRCPSPKGSNSTRTKSVYETTNSVSVSPSRPAFRLFNTHTMVMLKDGRSRTVDDLDIQIAPLHIRLDLEFILQSSGPFAFYEDLFLAEISFSDTTSVSSGETVDKFPALPLHAKTRREEGHANADVSRRFRSSLTFDFLRFSIRCPPPENLSKRSGTLIIDLHDTHLFMDSQPPTPITRFSESDLSQEMTLSNITIDRAILASSCVDSTTAISFLSIGFLKDDNLARYTDAEQCAPPLKPRLRIIRPNPPAPRIAPTLALSIDLPSLYTNLNKVTFDSLQYWADDLTQLLERISGHEPETELNNIRNPSVIGSRFLAKSRSSSALVGTQSEGTETVIKVSITEAFICIMLPREDAVELRPFCVKASDLDMLMELNPEQRQQTILTVGIADLVVDNVSRNGDLQIFLSLTSRHSLSASPTSIVKFRFSTTTVPETGKKETRIKLTTSGFTYTFYPDMLWISDLAAFSKNPPGTFESVIPSDRTRISVKMSDGSIRILAPEYPGAIVCHMQDLDLSTDVTGDSRDSAFRVLATCVTMLAIDDAREQDKQYSNSSRSHRGVAVWMAAGYALLAEFIELDTNIVNQIASNPAWKVLVDRIVLRLHLCADTLTAVTAFIQDLAALISNPDDKPKPSTRRPAVVEQSTIMASVEDLAFKRMPQVGPPPDMISDDLPTNLDYLDESFGTAAGLRELVDEDLDQFSDEEVDISTVPDDPHITSRVGGETIKVFDSKGLDVMEDYYLSIPPDKFQGSPQSSDAALSVRIVNSTFNLFLYDGYDWAKTRKTIEEEVKEMRKRLAKIRQLVANGQIQEPVIEDTSTLLYNSVHIGLEQDEDMLEEPSALIAAIDEELQEDLETTSQSSWQSLQSPGSSKPRARSTRVHGKRLTRSRMPSIEFSLGGLYMEFDQYGPSDPLVSRTFITVKDLEILDHIRTSTWKKFLTDLRSDSRGNVRETDSNMVRIELQGIRPVAGNASEEARLRAKILPLRLYVDQDAVDFLKKFFSFKDPDATPSDTSGNEDETYIQMGEIFPIDLKLDYKPRRVDYRALKEGRTIELMNFFHFDGAEMTLRHITLAGVTGWPKFFEMLNDLWTPDVKATQLVEVISGVAPIRSVVNVGSGVADLILLPIAQYKKDGRIVRGVQKGATAFVKSTAIEAIKMGAKLATGTQVILEQAEGILGGQFEVPVTAEPVQTPYGEEPGYEDEEDDGNTELISKYAQQPADLKEGVQTAYKSLRRNLNSAAQTILAVPMEVYERSGNEGPVRSVIRAVPIAVLKPMIGASEAVSKTLLGLHNTLDPNIRHDNEAKYKLR